MKRTTVKLLVPILGLLMMLLLTGCPKKDGKNGDFSLDTLLVSTPDNISPVSVAGIDYTIFLGDTLVLNGVESYDQDGEIISYEWFYSDGTSLGNQMILTFQTSGLQVGTYEISLLVTDDDGATGIDTLIVNIINRPVTETTPVPDDPTPAPSPDPDPVNQAPIADAGDDQSITVFGLNNARAAAPAVIVNLDGSGSSDDGLIQPLTYAWAKTNHLNIPLPLNDSTSQTPSFSVTCSDNWVGNCTSGVDSSTCRYEFTLTVNDGEFTATDTVDIDVDYSPCKFGQD